MFVHPTAIVSREVELEEDVYVGAFSVIEGRVRIGKGTRIGNRVSIKGWVEIGKNCKIYDGAVLGEEPQHLKYRGEETKLIIGDGVVIREYCTIHRGTALDKGVTKVGNNCYLMVGTHIAHDCIIGDGVITANNVAIGGHVEIGKFAVLGGLCAVHQFARIGEYAMVGGLTGVSLDVPPYTVAVGERAKLYGINVRGLRRHNFPEERIRRLKRAYRIIFRTTLSKEEAIRKVLEEVGETEEIRTLINFLRSTKRGITKDANL